MICASCGTPIPSTRVTAPSAPSRVAMVDAGALARIVQSGATTTLVDVVDALARSPRFLRCVRCGALFRVGDIGECWIPGPDMPPTEQQRRVVVLRSPRVEFAELWSGARAFEVVALPLDVGAGDLVRIVEEHAVEQRDPLETPRHVVGLVQSMKPIVNQFAGGGGIGVLGFRLLTRGFEDRAIESRRARMVDALAMSEGRIAGAAMLLGISLAESYRWVHELGLDDRIKTYRPRSRSRTVQTKARA